MIDVQSTLLRRCNIFVKKEDIYTCVCVYAYVYTYVYILWIYYREREKKKLSIVERIAPTRDSKRGDGTDGRIHDDTISRNMSRIDEYVEESLG